MLVVVGCWLRSLAWILRTALGSVLGHDRSQGAKYSAGFREVINDLP